MSSTSAADTHFESDGYSATTPPSTEIEHSPLPSLLDGKLVRLRKNLSCAVSVIESHKHFQNSIAPLFPEQNLVEPTIFHPTLTLLRDCNAGLRQMERDGTRPEKRHGIYLVEDEDHGCLVTDMACDLSPEYVPFEFKPKWLAQSPNAPAGSKRCRTCALRAMEGARSDIPSPTFCPLGLVSPDVSKVEKAVSQMLGKDPLGLHATLLQFFDKNPLLMRLRELQLEMDPNGVLGTVDLTSSKFLVAMTLRDCSLFLKVRLAPVQVLGSLH
ncbi:MAG: hypothetical protein Q9163_004282 [Psora crenata]